MKSYSVKAYGKVNICLNITGKYNGYHNIDSLVTTIALFDYVKATKRKDDKILITFTGRYAEKNYIQSETNAYKTAELFKKTFHTSGVNIDIERNIPSGGGLGSSSADISGVLKAMSGLFEVKEDLKSLADTLGSDSGYLLSGGYARLTGRGEKIEKINSDKSLYFLIIIGNSGVSTKECYKKFDDIQANGNVSDIESSIQGLITDDFEKIGKGAGNALYAPAVLINCEIEENMSHLKGLSPSLLVMSGSGSAVFAAYETYEMASWAYDKLKRKFGKRLILTQNYNPNHISFIEKYFIYRNEN